jgi:hypothetical protein
MNERDRQLNQAIEALPRDIPPRRDLWPDIEARLHARELDAPAPDLAGTGAGRRWLNGWQAAAAAVLLMSATSLVTFVATRQHYEPDATYAASDGGTGFTLVSSEVLPIDYRMARGELMAVLESSLDRLDPTSRRIVETNLAEIRTALAAIDRALADDPDNASLQQLFVATTQQELSLLQSVQRLAQTTQQDQQT